MLSKGEVVSLPVTVGRRDGDLVAVTYGGLSFYAQEYHLERRFHEKARVFYMVKGSYGIKPILDEETESALVLIGDRPELGAATDLTYENVFALHFENTESLDLMIKTLTDLKVKIVRKRGP